MNIIELKANEVSEVSGGFGWETVFGFAGGKVGILAGAGAGIFADVFVRKGGRAVIDMCRSGGFVKAMRGREMFLFVSLVSTAFAAANIAGEIVGAVISRPFVWAGLVDE